ncbi:ABC transporter permease [Spirochaetia bacterium]|nr:ABC transporter permease [Spirochaetia bacterium]
MLVMKIKMFQSYKKDSMLSWLAFVGPAMAIISVFVLYPIISVFILSFQKFNMASAAKKIFVGFQNYKNMFSQTGDFLNSLKVTLIYTLVGVTSTMILGVGLALLLNSQGVIIRILRGISLIPYLICGVALAFAWVLLYNTSFGLLNIIFEAVHIPQVDWLGSSRVAIYSLAIIETWQFTPFVMILTLAGLQGITADYYEAAAIDGAGKVRMLFNITLPLLKNVLLSVLILRLIDCIKAFEKVRILTMGGPMNSTDLISHNVYKAAFLRSEMGLGAAGAVIITLIIAALSFIVMKTVDNKDAV